MFNVLSQCDLPGNWRTKPAGTCTKHTAGGIGLQFWQPVSPCDLV